MTDKLSPHFSRSEYACKDGCGLDNIDPRHAVISEIVREFEGGDPYNLNSACRCLLHNETVQKEYNSDYVPFSSNSTHMPHTPDGAINEEEGVCTAVDYPSKNPKKLFVYLNKLFPDMYGMGLYRYGVHVDTRFKRARW